MTKRWTFFLLLTASLLFTVSAFGEARAVEAAETAEPAACTVPADLVPADEVPVADFFRLDAVNACNCRDTCFSDSFCQFYFGPGSTCEPQPPCGCRECVQVSSS